MEIEWIQTGAEPALWELMSDPIVLLLMRRDGVTPADLQMGIDALRRRRWPHAAARQPFIPGFSPETAR